MRTRYEYTARMEQLTWTAFRDSPGAAIPRAPLLITYGRGQVVEVFRLDPCEGGGDAEVNATAIIRHSGRIIVALRAGKRVRVTWLGASAAMLTLCRTGA